MFYTVVYDTFVRTWLMSYIFNYMYCILLILFFTLYEYCNTDTYCNISFFYFITIILLEESTLSNPQMDSRTSSSSTLITNNSSSSIKSPTTKTSNIELINDTTESRIINNNSNNSNSNSNKNHDILLHSKNDIELLKYSLPKMLNCIDKCKFLA